MVRGENQYYGAVCGRGGGVKGVRKCLTIWIYISERLHGHMKAAAGTISTAPVVRKSLSGKRNAGKRPRGQEKLIGGVGNDPYRDFGDSKAYPV